jgi:hypothetical protein
LVRWYVGIAQIVSAPPAPEAPKNRTFQYGSGLPTPNQQRYNFEVGRRSMECGEKERLLLVYKATTGSFSHAVNQLKSNRPTAKKDEYDDLLRLSEDAARTELEDHVSKHGC